MNSETRSGIVRKSPLSPVVTLPSGLTAQQLVPKKNNQRKKARPAKKGINNKYYLKGDATPLRRDTLLVNNTKARTYLVDFMINDLFTVTSGTSTIVYGGLAFKLNQYPNYAAWTVNFDKYRIRGIELHFVSTGIQENVSTSQIAGTFHTCLDFDNDATPTSIAEVNQASRSTECVQTSSFRRHFIPRVGREIYNGVASTNYEEAEPWVWLDCASAATPHYGLKYAMGTASTTSYVYRCMCRMTVEFGFPIG